MDIIVSIEQIELHGGVQQSEGLGPSLLIVESIHAYAASHLQTLVWRGLFSFVKSPPPGQYRLYDLHLD